MKWETWDPDVTCLENTDEGCIEGAKPIFVMKSGGMKVPMTLKNVKKDETLTFEGSYKGVYFKGDVELVPGEDEGKTLIKYSFELSGILGALFGFFNKKAVVVGTEKGLENMVTLSEEAQKAS